MIFKPLTTKTYKLASVLVIFLVWIGLVGVTYEPGTWLSGWDTLHPEFNLRLYAERTFLGAWQEHQGLGAAASQSHIAEITRLPLLWLLQLLLPDSAIRWAFILLTWLVGMLGMNLLIQHVVLYDRDKRTAAIVGCFVGVLYLLNPVMLQHFYLPLEMFAVHFASLPWLFMGISKFMSTGKGKYLWQIGLVALFSSSQAHTATLFYVLLGAVGGYLLVLASIKGNAQAFKRMFGVMLVLILTNLFWMGPNIYYALAHGKEVVNSTISHLFSNSAFLRSREYGNLTDLLQFRNFLFSWQLYNFSSNAFVSVFESWKNQLDLLGVIGWNWLVWGMAFLGGLVAIRKKETPPVSMGVLIVVGMIFWINQNPPFFHIFSWLRTSWPVFFGEALRFPFTKFSILLLFGLMWWVALALDWLLSIFQKPFKFIWRAIVMALMVGGMFYSMLPAWRGGLISDAMKVEMPDEYFSLFEWFNTQENGRVLLLPLHSYWGWEYFDWGYQGAGFSWFGIKQPTLNREFDRWNKSNETAYFQLKLAMDRAIGELATDDSKYLREFLRLLHAYRIEYVAWDTSVMTPLDTTEKLQEDQIRTLLNKAGLFQVFSEGNLSVYSISIGENAGNYAHVSADTDYASDDVLGRVVGNYFDSSDKRFSENRPVYYPYINFDVRAADGANITFNESAVVFSKRLDLEGDYYVHVPEIFDEREWPISVWGQKHLDGMKVVISVAFPEIKVNGTTKIASRIYEREWVFADVNEIDYLFVDDQSFLMEEVTSEKKLLGYIWAESARLINIEVETAKISGIDADEVFTELLDRHVFEVETLHESPTLVAVSGLVNLEVIYPFEKATSLTRFSRTDARNCDVYSRGEVETFWSEDEIRFVARNEGSNCNLIVLDELDGFESSLVRIRGHNNSGEGLRVYMRDANTLANTWEELVFGDFDLIKLGYGASSSEQVLSFHTKAYGGIQSENVVTELIVLPFPAEWISSFSVIPFSGEEFVSRDELVTNNQAFEGGWVAFVDGRELPHVKVNGWENGWVLPKGVDVSQVKVVFWPQYLEWGGLVVLVMTLGWLGYKARKS